MSGFENISNEEITKFHEILDSAECVVVGAGAGLSASAGFSYSGGRFRKYFSDFEAKYHFHDMYSGGFADFPSLEENWAYWSRFIYINRYLDAPLPVYEKLLELVRAKDYFVITTNVDHCFQKAGFDKKRLFYTQGDYGLFQCCVPCHKKTYDNEEIVKKMLISQGFGFKDSENRKDGEIIFQENPLKMEIPSELVPHCPVCGKPMSMNLRCDGTFVEDDGWHEAARRYQDFLEKHKNAFYASLNMEKEEIPIELKARSVLIKGDIFRTIGNLI